MTGLHTGPAWTTAAAVWIWICRTRQKPGHGLRYYWKGTAPAETIQILRMLAHPKLTTAYFMESLLEAANSPPQSIMRHSVKSKRITPPFYCNFNMTSAYLRPNMRVIQHYFREKFMETHGLPCTLMELHQHWAPICIHNTTLELTSTQGQRTGHPKWSKTISLCKLRKFLIRNKTHFL